MRNRNDPHWNAIEWVCVCVWVCVHNQSGRNGRIAQDLLANRLKYDPSCCCCCRWNIVPDYIFIFVVFDVRTCYGTMAFHVWMGAAHTCNRPITCHHQRLLEDGVSQPKKTTPTKYNDIIIRTNALLAIDKPFSNWIFGIWDENMD